MTSLSIDRVYDNLPRREFLNSLLEG